MAAAANPNILHSATTTGVSRNLNHTGVAWESERQFAQGKETETAICTGQENGNRDLRRARK